jgi:DNA-binding transcriptional ArsR family regulator
MRQDRPETGCFGKSSGVTSRAWCASLAISTFDERTKHTSCATRLADHAIMSICSYSNMSTGTSRKLSVEQIEAISRLFAVMSDPSRLLLLQALHDGPLTVSQLEDACEMKQANVSKHLAVLRDHHLVRRERDGASVKYEIADPMIFSLCNLVCGKMERDVKEAAAVFQPEI